jgi:hypothetical protein
VTPREVLPALLIAHDPLGEAALTRVKWIVEGAGSLIVGCTASEFTAAVAAVALEEVGAYDAFAVVHFVGPLDDPGLAVTDHGAEPVDALVAAVTGVNAGIRARFPGKQRIDHWVIHTVGQVVDESERQFVERVARDTDLRVRGVIVSASATHVSVTHDDDEQACFAADIALALLGSDLEQHLAQAEPVAWVGGATSLSYAGARVGEAISTFCALRMLDEHLLAESPAGDPSFDEGVQWVEGMGLTGPLEREHLLASTSGGSLLSRIRMEHIDWEAVPITSWSDVLTTQQLLLANEEFDPIREVIEANGRKRLEELKASVIARSFEQLESTFRFESTLEFDRGVRAGLEHARQELPEPVRSIDPEIVEKDRARLRRFTRWLPFGAAVALRVFAAALGALVVVSARTGSTDLPVLDHFSKPWGRLTALAVLIAGFVLYRRRLKRTLKVRDRLREELELQLVDTAEQWTADARRQVLVDLRSWVGDRPPWIDDGQVPDRPEFAASLVEWFAWLVRESRLSREHLVVRAHERRHPAGLASRFAVDIPLATHLSTEELAGQLLRDPPKPGDAARSLAVVIRPECQPGSLRVLSRDELEAVWTRWLVNQLGAELWHDLASLLMERPSIRDAARGTIEANTTPALVAADNAPSVGTRHYLALPGGAGGAAYQRLFSADIEPGVIRGRKVTDSLTDVLDMRIADLVLMVHLYALDFSASPTTETSSTASSDDSEGDRS